MNTGPPACCPPKSAARMYDVTLRPQGCWTILSARRQRGPISRCSIEAAKSRGEALDHVLFVGPPGLGKTDAGADYGARARRQFPVQPPARSSPRREISPALLTNLEDRDVLFIDENPPPQSGGRGKSSIRRWRISSST